MQEIIQFSSKHPILSLIWLTLLLLLILSNLKKIFSKVKAISSSSVINLINKEDAIVVDVRLYDNYRKGHILGSFNITAEDITKGNLGRLEKYSSKPIIVVCSTGYNAGDLAAQLYSAGFSQVYVLKDGISGWINENLPLVCK